MSILDAVPIDKVLLYFICPMYVNGILCNMINTCWYDVDVFFIFVIIINRNETGRTGHYPLQNQMDHPVERQHVSRTDGRDRHVHQLDR